MPINTKIDLGSLTTAPEAMQETSKHSRALSTDSQLGRVLNGPGSQGSRLI